MSTVDILKKQFLDYITNKQKDRTEISQQSGGLTLATFNVHYWTDVNENNKSKEIIEDIKKIKADIIILQEAALGDFTIDKQKILGNYVVNNLSMNGYKKQILCNTVPSWWNIPYGNLALIHDSFINTLNCDGICSILNETNYTFKKSDTTVTVSGKHQGTLETRCYVKIVIPISLGKTENIVVYGTHLDVASEKTRDIQITQIINDAEKYHAKSSIIIMGDFNTIDDEQYKNTEILRNLESIGQKTFKVIKTLKKKGFNDAFTVAGITPPDMTTWNNSRVDFIFVKNIERSDIAEIKPIYTINSDHLPIFIRLNNTTAKVIGNISLCKTKMKIVYNGKSYTIYEGKRGGKYIKINNTFISIKKLGV